MALITCPDCSRQVSTEAVACPECGRPMKSPNQQAGLPNFYTGSSGTSGAQQQPTPMVVRSMKSRGVFIILGVLLGLLGIHNFYAGYYGRGAAQLIITLLLGWVIIGIVITGLWVLIELFTVREDADGNTLA